MKITKTQLKQIIKEEIDSSIDEGFLDMFKRSAAKVPEDDAAKEKCLKKHDENSDEYEICMNTERALAAAKEQGFKDGMPSPWYKGQNIYGDRR